MEASSKLPKIGRNESCRCGSERKYKFCCLAKESESTEPKLDFFTLNQMAESSPHMTLYRESLLSRYPDHSAIDISDNMTPANSNTYQIRNAGRRIVMLAERSASNQLVFDKKQGSDSDAIVMYRGYYCFINYRNFRQSLRDIYAMIDARI